MTLAAYLDGEALTVDSGAGWTLIDGVDPYELELTLPAELAERLFAASAVGGSTLTLVAGAEREAIEGLTILGTGPSDTPHHETLTLVDLRRDWAYGPLIRRDYNMTRKSGLVRVVSGDDAPLAARDLADDLSYFPDSLNEGKVWKATEIAKDVLDRIAPNGWVDRDKVLTLEFSPVQNFQLMDNPAPALAKVLALLGGRVGVFVRPDKTVVLYDRLSGGEELLVGGTAAGGTRTRGQAGRPQIVGGKLWSKQDRRRERPAAVVCHFVVAAELRVDHVELSTAQTEAGAVPITASQVTRLPEDVTIRGEVVRESTWVPTDDYITALTGQTISSGSYSFPDFSRELLRKAIHHGILAAYALADESGVWAFRGAALDAGYRQQYRVTPTWVDRVRGIRPYRVGISDAETRSRASSLVYQDYAESVTFRSPFSRQPDDPPVNHDAVRNRYSNPAAEAGGSIVGTPIGNLRPAPASVTIEDEELGVFSVSLQGDFTGQTSVFYRSPLAVDRIPSHDLASRRIYLEESWLAEGHELSVIFTVQPSSPNDERQLYQVQVTPAQLAGKLPARDARRAEGPVMHVLIEATREIARFAWDDDKAEQILQAFAPGKSVSVADAYGDPINKQVLEGLAQAVATRVYLSYEDHVEGALVTGFYPAAEPAGTAKSVTHNFGRSTPQTVIDLPSTPPRVAEVYPVALERLLGGYVDP